MKSEDWTNSGKSAWYWIDNAMQWYKKVHRKGEDENHSKYRGKWNVHEKTKKCRERVHRVVLLHDDALAAWAIRVCGERYAGGFVEDLRHTSIMFWRAFCSRVQGKGIVSDRVMGDGLTKVTAGSYSPGNGETFFVFYYMGTISC